MKSRRLTGGVLSSTDLGGFHIAQDENVFEAQNHLMSALLGEEKEYFTAVDGVEMTQLRDVFHQMNHDIIPKCTYCINSGHGLHLYYLLEKPVPLYKHLQDKLREFKYELIAKVWNRYTSTFTEREQVQYQGIFQGFRMVGTQSKLGKRYPVKAFETGERVTIEYLNGYLMDKSKAVTDFHYKSNLSLAEARKKYPEWYEKRIVQGEHRERWHIKRDLYDWWLRK